MLSDLVAVSAAVAATSKRTEKTALIADLLRGAGAADARLAVAYLSGAPPQRRPGVGWASLREQSGSADEPTLTLADVDAALTALEGATGSGSQARRKELLDALMAKATKDEQRFLVALIAGELRQGAQQSLVVDALAAATGIAAAVVRRAVMLRGDAAAVAAVAVDGGEEAVARIGLTVGRVVQPMLASSASTPAEALAKTGRAAVDTKLDGIRIQVHRDGDDVHVFTRTLDDVTHRLPEVVDAVMGLPVQSVVLDGEAIALRADGRPRPFQETASRAATRGSSDVRLSTFFFDVLHLDGVDLLDRPGAERWKVLDEVVPAALRVDRTVTDDPAEADAVLAAALAAGHEGVVVKSVTAPWEAGRRGAGWVKVKPVHTLDLVVLAAEWGHGRRRGWLSNLHLGARDESSPTGFVMLGKTFKGLTDAMLAEQTEALQLLRIGDDHSDDDGWTVRVRPERVVEIAFDGVQASTRYPAGMALRFARVVRFRPDKTAEQADDVAAVRAVFEAARG
ncbi:MAG TPA: ATP-dependent DNA ligase [Mycobacteriales bacterium]|nr:ATP-dependent DNA ligase [Mycobacteriales bacterium]